MQTRNLGPGAPPVTVVGFGGMPLSTDGRPDESTSIAVLHAALDSGMTLIDTADVYCLDHTDIGHNERLIAKALSTWSGDRGAILVATKGGLIRPEGRWERNAHPDHLRKACEASLVALGVERIALYQIHAPDPEVPWADSIGELSRLRDEGKIRWVGLSNVSVAQIEEAQEIVPVQTVQNRLSPFFREALTGGVVDFCARKGIGFLAYSPVGGGRLNKKLPDHPVAKEIAEKHGALPHEVVLAWVLAQGDSVLLIPGARTVEHMESSVRAAGLRTERVRSLRDRRGGVLHRVTLRARADRWQWVSPRSAASTARREAVHVLRRRGITLGAFAARRRRVPPPSTRRRRAGKRRIRCTCGGPSAPVSPAFAPRSIARAGRSNGCGRARTSSARFWRRLGSTRAFEAAGRSTDLGDEREIEKVHVDRRPRGEDRRAGSLGEALLDLHRPARPVPAHPVLLRGRAAGRLEARRTPDGRQRRLRRGRLPGVRAPLEGPPVPGSPPAVDGGRGCGSRSASCSPTLPAAAPPSTTTRRRTSSAWPTLSSREAPRGSRSRNVDWRGKWRYSRKETSRGRPAPSAGRFVPWSGTTCRRWSGS